MENIIGGKTVNARALVGAFLTTCLLHFLIFGSVAFLLHGAEGDIFHVINSQDEGEYTNIAYSLLSSGKFQISNTIEPETFRTIGYPALAAFIFALSGGSLWALYAVHALITGLTAATVVWIGTLLGLSRRVSLISGILFGLSSGPILLTVSGMGSDKIFPLLYALSAGLLLTFERGSPYTRAASIGAIMGLATLVRPIGVLASLPIFAAILVIPSAAALPSIRKRVLAVGIALLVFIGILTPWMTRNYLVAGHFSISSLPVYNFVYYNIPLYYAAWEGQDEEAVRDAILTRLSNPDLMTLRGFAHHDALSEIQKEFLKEKLVPYALFHFYKMIPFFLSSGFNVSHAIISAESPSLYSPLFPSEQENLTSAMLHGDYATVWNNVIRYPIVTLERISWLVIFGLAFIAPLFAPKGPVRRFLFISIFLILSIGFLSSPVIQPRYRVPAEPLLWVGFVYTIAHGGTRFRAYFTGLKAGL